MCEIKGMISCADIQDSYQGDGLQYVLGSSKDYWSFIVLQTFSNCMYDYVDMRCLSFDMIEICIYIYIVSLYALLYPNYWNYLLIPLDAFFNHSTQLRWKLSWEKAMWKWNVPTSTRSTDGPVARRDLKAIQDGPRADRLNKWECFGTLLNGLIYGEQGLFHP